MMILLQDKYIEFLRGDLKFLSTYVAGCTSLDITLIYNRNGIGMQIIQLLLLYTERKPWNLDVKQTSINNEFLGITNDILGFATQQYRWKEPRYNETRPVITNF